MAAAGFAVTSGLASAFASGFIGGVGAAGLSPKLKPENRLWNLATRPPVSTSLRAPRIQAGWVRRSTSSFSLSPGLPQVERVSKLLPLVITTLIW